MSNVTDVNLADFQSMSQFWLTQSCQSDWPESLGRPPGRSGALRPASVIGGGHPQQADDVPDATAAASGCSGDQPVLGASTPHDIDGASPSTA